MKYKRFLSFREASTFAQDYARQNSCSVKLSREGIHWVVPIIEASNVTPHATKSLSIQHPHNKSSHEDSKNLRRETAGTLQLSQVEELTRLRKVQRGEGARKLAMQKLAERQNYLRERKTIYVEMSKEELTEAWDSCEKNKLAPDEKALLRHHYLAERKKLYLEMSKEELSAAWDNRKNDKLDTDEEALLKHHFRLKIGI